MDNHEEDYEDSFREVDREELINHIIEKATNDEILDHIKSGFKTFGIEGTEDVFRRIYVNHQVILDRYQAIYDNLIGRTKK